MHTRVQFAVVANIHVRVQVEARGRCRMLLLVESWMLSDGKELELSGSAGFLVCSHHVTGSEVKCSSRWNDGAFPKPAPASDSPWPFKYG